jgi:raffinose/stachyose/melibiose transport system permease protein
VIVANCVLVLNGSLRAYDIPYLLTNNGPGNSAHLLAPYMYKQAFSSMKYGYGSAVAVMIVIISLVFATVFRRIFERED